MTLWTQFGLERDFTVSVPKEWSWLTHCTILLSCCSFRLSCILILKVVASVTIKDPANNTSELSLASKNSRKSLSTRKSSSYKKTTLMYIVANWMQLLWRKPMELKSLLKGYLPPGKTLSFNSGQRKSEIHSCPKQTTGSNYTICMKLKASWNLNVRLRAAKVRFTQSEFRILHALQS